VGASLALLICTTGVVGLFFLDRDKSVRTSAALWLPVVWIWIAGSRPVSMWFGTGGAQDAGQLASTLDGSPMDAAVFEAIIVLGVVALILRRQKVVSLLKANGPILTYFSYCLLSTLWSPVHGPAFKRWIKDAGDLVMALLIMTDPHPIVALRRVYSRVGFILFPLSVTLIRYTDLGRGYDPDGGPMNQGVTLNKNSLGLIVYLVSLGALWNVRALISDKNAPNRSRRLTAQCTLLAFGIVLLQMAHSATSIFCFSLGAGLMLASGLQAIRRRPNRLHALCIGILAFGAVMMLFGGESVVTSALGRKSNLSGRTEIWKACFAAADSPVFGTGFESFWNVNVEKVAVRLRSYWHIHNLVSAHNGYIQIYLDLGVVGICLIALILVSSYLRASKAFQRNRELGRLLLAYIVTAAFYSITEAGFRTLTPAWIFLLLAAVGARGVAAGLIVGEKTKVSASRGGGRADKTGAAGEPALDVEAVYAAPRGLYPI
jgi:exopolysaccharide production protein ExoQ